jgi:hypothetical protein
MSGATRDAFRTLIVATVAIGFGAAPATAQAILPRGATEASVGVSAAHGITLLESQGGDRYATAQIAWGRILTDARGPGRLRGRFEWSVEATPILAQWRGGHAVGLGVTPLAWRWNIERSGRVRPFVDVGGGALWTTEPLPAGTTGSNFTSHAGVGVRMLGPRGSGWLVSYRLHHISNGNRLRRNPGVNAHMLTVAWTRVRQP